MSYVNRRESRGHGAIAADDWADYGLGAVKARSVDTSTRPKVATSAGGPKVVQQPRPRVQAPVKADTAVFSPAGPTRATSIAPAGGALPWTAIITMPDIVTRTPAGAPTKGSGLPSVTVEPRVGGKTDPGSPPVITVPVYPSTTQQSLPEIIMTGPPPTRAPASSSSGGTSGGPSPGAFPMRPNVRPTRPGGGGEAAPEYDTLDIRPAAQVAAPGGLSTKTIAFAAAGVAAVGLLVYLTRRKST